MPELLALALLVPAHGLAQAGDAARIHRDAIVIDGHNDVGSWILDYGFDLGTDGADPAKHNAEWYWVMPRLLPTPTGETLRTHTDLARLKTGGVDAVFFSVFAHPRFATEPGGTRARALRMIEALNEQAGRHAESLAPASSSGDIRRIAAQGKIALLLGLEGGHAIGNDVANLRDFYERGVRYLTLTWSNTNGWADSSGDSARHGGLSEFGREVVREMNRLGMMVDVSHASDETFWDAIETTDAPLIASHSGARALVDIPRNMSDEMLRAVATNGGVVMVSFGGSHIDRRKSSVWRIAADMVRGFGPSPVPIENLLDQIDHVVQVAGVEHVGLGSDFDGTLFMPVEVPDVAGFPAITRGLLERGYAAESLRKILGENLLRAFEAVEARSESGR